MDPSTPAIRGIAAMRRGILFIAFGVGALIFISLKASDGQVYFFMWGLVRPSLFIAAMIMAGLFEMIRGYAGGRGLSDPHDLSRVRSSAVLCVAVLAIGALTGGAAWRYGTPFWSAAAALSRGEEAWARLKTIAERHAATMESGADGPRALASWKSSADGALPLRPDFDAAAVAAKSLETTATGSFRTRAAIDARFYAICLEWIDLYASIGRTLAEESMAEPPEEWTERQNALGDRIEALPPLPSEGS